MKRWILIGVLLAGSAWCLAADWPRWRGPAGTGHVPAGEAVPKTLPAKVKFAWRVKIGGGLASPVVAGGRVFYLDNQAGKETVHALAAGTGKELWRAELDEAFKDFQSAPGPRCTPVADGDRVYVQSCRGEFRCLGAADGTVRWRVNFVKDFGAVFFGEKGPAVAASRHGYSGSPVVDGDRILVGVGGRKGASVVCFDKRTGTVIWRSQDDVPGFGGPVLAELAGEKQVVSFTSEALIGLSAKDGALRWRVPIKTRLGRHVTTPCIAGDTVLVASHQAGLIAVRVTGQGPAARAAVAWTDRKWTINFASPVVVGGHLYGIGPASTLLCVDVRTGKTAWAQRGFFSDMTRKGYASFLVMGPNLLVLAEKGQLLLVAADPTQCRTLAKTTLCGQNWCNPAYADGKLFVRDDKQLLCAELLP